MSWYCHPDTMSIAFAQRAAEASGASRGTIAWLQAYRDAYAKQNTSDREDASLLEYLADLDREIEGLKSGSLPSVEVVEAAFKESFGTPLFKDRDPRLDDSVPAPAQPMDDHSSSRTSKTYNPLYDYSHVGSLGVRMADAMRGAPDTISDLAESLARYDAELAPLVTSYGQGLESHDIIGLKRAVIEAHRDEAMPAEKRKLVQRLMARLYSETMPSLAQGQTALAQGSSQYHFTPEDMVLQAYYLAEAAQLAANRRLGPQANSKGFKFLNLDLPPSVNSP